MRNIIAIISCIALAVFYYLFSFDRVSFGDCIGYVYFVERGEFTKTATSAEHFLYYNGLILFQKITQIETINSIRIFTSISASIAVFILYKTFRLYFNQKISILGALMFALSFTFWRITETIEVATFNSIFNSAFLYFSIKYLKEFKKNDLNLAALILGISFWCHVQNIMLIPALLYLFFISMKQNKSWYSTPIFFLIPAIALLVMPYIFNYNPVLAFGSTNKAWIEGTFTKSIVDYLKDTIVAIGYIIYNFWYFVIFGLISIFFRYSKWSKENTFFFLAFGIPFAFGTFYNVSDNYVYFIGPYQILIIFILDGIRMSEKKIKNTISVSFIGVLLFPILYLASLNLVTLIPAGNKFNIEKAYKGGLNYYLVPWMNNNTGVIDVVLNQKSTGSDKIFWMEESVLEFVKLRSKKQTLEEIKNL